MNDTDALLSFLRAELRAIKPALPAELPAEAHYRDMLNLDSLDLVELVARIEQHYGVMIPDADMPQFVSLDATARYVLARVEA
ncbi:MAG: acyl carrier protein [Burkholderiales bacterium]